MLIANCCPIVNRRQLPQAGNSLWKQAQSELNVLGGVLLAQAETEAGPRPVRTQSHGGQHVRWLDRSGRARGAGRNGQSLEIQRNDQSFAFDVIEVNVGCVGNAWSPFP